MRFSERNDMKKLLTTAAFTMAAAAALTSASSAHAKPVEVTRFAAPGPITRGPAAPATAAASLEQTNHDAIVARELARAGFTGEGDARFTYTVEVTRNVRPRAARRAPVTIGIGGGGGRFGGGFGGGGVGLGASFGVGGRGRDVTVTRLSVVLRDHTTRLSVWEGRAEAESTKPGGEPIERLAAALFRDFPGESGRTISVK